MKREDLGEIAKFIDTAIDTLEERLLRRIDDKIESYRKSTWGREHWCCDDMAKFANDVWGANKPRGGRDDARVFGSTAYMLRDHIVNYCPFCGVKAS